MDIEISIQQLYWRIPGFTRYIVLRCDVLCITYDIIIPSDYHANITYLACCILGTFDDEIWRPGQRNLSMDIKVS